MTKHTCPATAPDLVQVPLLSGYSAQQLITIIAGTCTAFSCLISFYLIMRHATHYSLPKEQKQVIRIIFIIPVFAVISLLSVIFYDSAIYLKTIVDLYESLALASFFILLCTFVQEDEEQRHVLFATSGATKRYTTAIIGAFQFPAVMFVVLIVTVITEASGIYCDTSNKAYFSKIWLTIIIFVSTFIALFSIIRFYAALRSVINRRKPFSKLLAFKAIVFLDMVQHALFSFFTSSNKLVPTTQYTFKDLSTGIPNLLIALEMVIFSLLFLYIYRTHEYYFKNGALAVPLGHGGYQGGFLGYKALLQALNIVDLIQGIMSVPKTFSARRAATKKLSEDQGENLDRMPENQRHSLPNTQFYGAAGDSVPPQAYRPASAGRR